jgi:hypothetical protein
MNKVSWRARLREGAISVLALSASAAREPSGAAMAFTNVDGVTVVGNHQAIQHGRTPPMHVARFWNCNDVMYHDNWPSDDV